MLERQVRRMLKDPRAEALTANFAGQWLNLRGLQSVGPLPLVYPDFDDPLRQAMRREVELLFDSIVREDRSVDGLADGRLHLRQRTAGEALRHPEHLRQSVPARDARSGHGRAARAARQRRVPRHDVETRAHVAGDARQVDHDQRPRRQPAGPAARRAAAPAARGRRRRQRGGADDAPEDAGPSRAARLRAVPQPDGSDRLLARELRRDRHLAHPATGTRRSTRPGSCSTERRSTDPRRCGSGWATYSTQFVQVVTEKLLVYALGRGVEYQDMPLVRAIARDAARNQNRFSALVLGVVNSKPFQMNMKVADPMPSHAVDSVDSGPKQGSEVGLCSSPSDHVPRRTFLKSAGCTLALPLLDAMLPASVSAGGDGGRDAQAALRRHLLPARHGADLLGTCSGRAAAGEAPVHPGVARTT